MNRFRTFFAASLLLCAANAGATCTASWAYFETRSSGPALVRCDGPNETLTLWQQPDEFGNQVWAHSPASSLDKQHALATLDWDDLNPQGFATKRMAASKHLFVELLASGETVLIGTNAFPADTHLAADLDIVSDGSANPNSVSVVVWSRSSSAEGVYEIGGNRASGAPRLVRLNGHDLFTSGLTLSGTFVSPPSQCPTCVNFAGTLAIIAGSGADHFYADARAGQTNVFAHEGDDTFNIFGVDHLGPLTINAGSGGANTAYIGASGSVAALQGPLMFDGGNCADALYVSFNASADNVSRQVSTFAQLGSGVVSGFAPADVSFHCDTAFGVYPAWLELKAGPKTDAFSIDGLFAQETHIDGGGGDDFVALKMRHDLVGTGPLFVNSATGTVSLELDDRDSTIATDVELRKDYAYFTNRTTHARMAWVIWNDATDVENVTLRLGKSLNDVSLFAIPDDVSYFIRGGDGGTNIHLAGEKIGLGSSLALTGGAGRDVFTMTPVAPGSGLVSVNGGGEPPGCGPGPSQCGDVLNYLGKASGAVPTSGVLVPPPGDLSNVVFFDSIEAFDGIFNGCFQSGACTP